MKLESSITAVKGVGPALAAKLTQLGIKKVQDLINFYPRRYEDFSQVISIAQLQPGPITVKVTIQKVTARYVRRGLHITEAIVSDESGSLRAVWFNQPYRADSLKSSDEFYMSGVFDFQRDRFVLQNPSVERVSHFAKNTARIIPIYPETKGLKSTQIRQLLHATLPLIATLPDPLPPMIVQQQGLLSYAEAVGQIHFPDSSDALERAKQRLAFQELFELLLASQLNREEHHALQAWKIAFDQTNAQHFVNQLSFELTDAQRRAAWEIFQDMGTEQPMNRLLQGDVGSGKTVVAAFAAFMAQHQGMQTAFMAPTEILAAQHAQSLAGLLEPLGVRIALLVGSVQPRAKKLLYHQLQQGNIDIIVGTHALIQDPVEFAKLGLVVIDEQHRFGVNQRAALLAKGERMPHVLSMTATPIPRSLTLTVYGELDVSILRESPKGRQPILTSIKSITEREQLYAQIDAQITQGRQVYIVCPLVSESDSLGFKSVEEEYARLNKTIFAHRRIGMLHGKLTAAEKDSIMNQFKNNQLDILIATTVVEVGVDVPNATIMIIEGADHFGLSQLHQLRGRVGRGQYQSYCYLMPSKAGRPSQRLQEVARSTDGFYLAEVDLRLRGPGEIYGTRQHGTLDLRIARITDTQLIALVQKVVKEFMVTRPNLLEYAQLHARINRLRHFTTLN